jgi:hypothetical protein
MSFIINYLKNIINSFQYSYHNTDEECVQDLENLDSLKFIVDETLASSDTRKDKYVTLIKQYSNVLFDSNPLKVNFVFDDEKNIVEKRQNMFYASNIKLKDMLVGGAICSTNLVVLSNDQLDAFKILAGIMEEVDGVSNITRNAQEDMHKKFPTLFKNDAQKEIENQYIEKFKTENKRKSGTEIFDDFTDEE